MPDALPSRGPEPAVPSADQATAHGRGTLGRLGEGRRTPLRANAYALVANQILSAGLGLLYWMLAARLYGAAVVGASSAVISTLLLVSGLAELGLNGGMVRFLPRAGQRARRLILAAYGASIAASVLLALAALVVARGTLGIGGVLGTGAMMALWVVSAAVLRTLFRLQDAVLTGLKQAKWVLYENTIYNVAKIAILVAGVGFLANGGIVGSWFIPTPLVVVLCAWLIFAVYARPARLAPPPADAPPLTLLEVARSAGLDHVGTVVAEAASRLLPLLVVAVLGAVANAYFYQAWLVAGTLALFAGSMTDSFVAEAAGDPSDISRYSRDILRQMATIVLPAAAVLGLGAPLILALFGKAYAAEGSTLLRVLCVSSPLVVFNTWYLAYARVTRRIRLVVLLEFAAAAILLGASYLLLGPLGIAGVGVAWGLSQLPVAVVGVCTSHRVLAVKRDPGD